MIQKLHSLFALGALHRLLNGCIKGRNLDGLLFVKNKVNIDTLIFELLTGEIYIFKTEIIALLIHYFFLGLLAFFTEALITSKNDPFIISLGSFFFFFLIFFLPMS